MLTNKPMTAAAAIMASNQAKQITPSPSPAAPTTKTCSQLTKVEPELPVESLEHLHRGPAGVLNVSDAFPLPSCSLGSNADGKDKQANQKSTARYTASILPRLSALGADANVVGFYCSTVHGQHCATPGFIETLISMQISSPAVTNPKTHKTTTATISNTLVRHKYNNNRYSVHCGDLQLQLSQAPTGRFDPSAPLSPVSEPGLRVLINTGIIKIDIMLPILLAGFNQK
ncbi:hypothetical protein H4Q26_003216 [Puccinia striiformis f. sp. tritici PST-130]|nr:hypothetical protein H4Q26_003216 [Puccinia striiformis f. sp. tritici PST-130]